MTIWTVYNNQGSQISGIFTNQVPENQKIRTPYSKTLLDLKLVSTGDGVSFPEGLSGTFCRSLSVMSAPPGVDINYDQALDFYWFDEDHIPGRIGVGSYGSFAPNFASTHSALAVGTFGNIIESLIFTGTSRTAVGSYADIYLPGSKKNWVAWSDIGSVDFTIGRDNVAGERPMDWAGDVWQIIQLGPKIIIYGSNGISIMSPQGINYTYLTVHFKGLLSRTSCTGNAFEHFFIDTDGDLYSFSESIKKLGYSEYLSSLVNPVMSYDSSSELLYICDNSLGFVYNRKEQSLGSGPVNITGICHQNGTSIIAAPAIAPDPAEIVIPPFEIWTDIIDFGNREAKTVESIEIGVDVDSEILMSIEYRNNKRLSFSRLPWQNIDPYGISYLFCHGREFRFGLKLNIYTYFELDYLNIKGRMV